jgi:hypothetical protein
LLIESENGQSNSDDRGYSKDPYQGTQEIARAALQCSLHLFSLGFILQAG